MKKLVLTLCVMVAAASLTRLHGDAWQETKAQAEGPQADSPVIEITAKRFEFSPKEITLKKGAPVTLRLKSEDVTHGFFVRPLKIDSDVPAGKSVDIPVTPQNTGKFVTICDHFCGTNHGNMKMIINVVE